MKIGDLFRKQSQTKAFPSQDNVSFYQLEPEVAGGWGEDTVADTTMQPPRVLQLDYCFDGWLGDDLLESFPVWIVTEKLAFLLQGSSLTGFTLDKMKTSYSEEFIDIYGRERVRQMPHFQWLKISGQAGVDDFGVSAEHRLVVSDTALELLHQVQIAHSSVSVFSAEPPEI